MCGRTYYNIDLDLLKKKFKCKKIIENEKLKKGIVNKNNYSPIIFQTQNNDDNGECKKDNILCVCSWGINPLPFRKMDDKIVLINARFETLASKKTFSALIGKNRCAIVVNGFFEWKSVDKDNAKNNKSKLPYFIFCKTGFSLLDEDVEKEEKEKEKENVKEEKLEGNSNVKEENDEDEGNVDITDNEPLLKRERNDLTENDESKTKAKRKFEEMKDANIKVEAKKTKTEKEEEIEEEDEEEEEKKRKRGIRKT